MMRRERPDHPREEDLVRLAAGEMAPAQAAALGAHLDTCVQCRSAFEGVRQALDDYTRAHNAMLDPRIPPAAPSRAALRRRLADTRAEPGAWAALLLLPTRKAGLVLGIAALLAVATVRFLTSRPGPQDADRSIAASGEHFAPDPQLTPGLAAAVSRDSVCAAGSEGSEAVVDAALALAVFRRYGIANPQPGAYEVDFLIPPELGGVKDVRNLWPQAYDIHPWNAHAKDALEDDLRQSVCDGRLSLEEAQRALAKGWIAAYKERFRTATPLVQHAAFLKDEPWQ
ncbi:MAG: hypothetical protein KDC27_17175 [Acidobacteria bacterium]|nr:hypothetical protein [Acidobacteriota bacterium]